VIFNPFLSDFVDYIVFGELYGIQRKKLNQAEYDLLTNEYKNDKVKYFYNYV